MFSYEALKLVHLVGILMIVTGLAALWGVCAAGAPVSRSVRVPLALIHGFGMTLALVGGLGLLSRMDGSQGLPGWVILKLLLWLLLGGSMVLAKRKATSGAGILGIFLFLGSLAALLAIYKPF